MHTSKTFILSLFALCLNLAYAADNPSTFATQFLNETFRGEPEKAVESFDFAQYKKTLNAQGINTSDSEARKILLRVLERLQADVKSAGLKSISIGEPIFNDEKTEALVPFTIETEKNLANISNTPMNIQLIADGDTWKVSYPENQTEPNMPSKNKTQPTDTKK